MKSVFASTRPTLCTKYTSENAPVEFVDEVEEAEVLLLCLEEVVHHVRHARHSRGLLDLPPPGRQQEEAERWFQLAEVVKVDRPQNSLSASFVVGYVSVFLVFTRLAPNLS